MIKFHFNKAYKYVTNTHPLHIFFDTIAVGLGTLAFTGIGFMIFMILTGGATNADFKTMKNGRVLGLGIAKEKFDVTGWSKPISDVLQDSS